MQIQVELRNVYGNQTIYPICEQAKLLAKLAGTKTITREGLAIMKSLGYKPVLIQQEL